MYQTKKKMNKGLKITLWVLLTPIVAILLIVFLIFSIFNASKFLIYKDYFSIRKDICINQGLNDNYVPQGIGYDFRDDYIYTSGYMSDKTASRIYYTDETNDYGYVKLSKKGEPFTGHLGGIAISNSIAYISTDKVVYKIRTNEIINSENGASVEVGPKFTVNNNSDFIYSIGKYLYIGEFHKLNTPYICDHQIKVDDNLTYNAIMTKYDRSDLTKPLEIFSIPNEIQGCAVLASGDIILSSSYSVKDSHYYYYKANTESFKQLNETIDGVKVTALVNPTLDLRGPAMSEGLALYKDGTILNVTEAACNKYIFGKLFFANKIVGLDFSKLLY